MRTEDWRKQSWQGKALVIGLRYLMQRGWVTHQYVELCSYTESTIYDWLDTHVWFSSLLEINVQSLRRPILTLFAWSRTNKMILCYVKMKCAVFK